MSVQTDYYIPQMKIKDETISQMAAEITKLRAERDAAAKTWRMRMVDYVSNLRQHQIDLDVRDDLLNFIVALPDGQMVIATEEACQ